MSVYTRIKKESTTIVSGTETEIIDLGNRVLAGVRIPSGVASNSFTIQESIDDGDSFLTLYNGNSQFGAVGDVSFSIAQNKSIYIPVNITAGAKKIKLVFNSSETNKVFELITREVN